MNSIKSSQSYKIAKYIASVIMLNLLFSIVSKAQCDVFEDVEVTFTDSIYWGTDDDYRGIAKKFYFSTYVPNGEILGNVIIVGGVSSKRIGNDFEFNVNLPNHKLIAEFNKRNLIVINVLSLNTGHFVKKLNWFGNCIPQTTFGIPLPANSDEFRRAYYRSGRSIAMLVEYLIESGMDHEIDPNIGFSLIGISGGGGAVASASFAGKPSERPYYVSTLSSVDNGCDLIERPTLLQIPNVDEYINNVGLFNTGIEETLGLDIFVDQISTKVFLGGNSLDPAIRPNLHKPFHFYGLGNNGLFPRIHGYNSIKQRFETTNHPYNIYERHEFFSHDLGPDIPDLVDKLVSFFFCNESQRTDTLNSNLIEVSNITRDDDSNIYLYPNPVSNVLYVRNLNFDILKFEIYNMYGQFQSRDIVKGNQIDVSDLLLGNYIIRLIDENSRSIGVRQFVVN